MDTIAKIRDEIIAAHNPELAKVEGGHLVELWQDGEITATKCGSLLGMRGLHTLMVGQPGFSIGELPVKQGDSFSAYLTFDQAKHFRDRIVAICGPNY